MTHILVNPGYSLKALKNGRARTAIPKKEEPATQARTALDGDFVQAGQKHNGCTYSGSELQHIRSESRQKWLAAWEDPGKPVVKSVYDWESTYSKQHDFKQLDEPTKSRPSSPTRRNNPHPPGVFLRLRVSKDKVHPAANPKPGQNPYEGKYIYDCPSVPDGTMYYTLKEVKRLKRDGQKELLKKITNPHERSNSISYKLPGDGRKIRPNSPERNGSYFAENHNEQEVILSLHRWLKCAGKEERDKMKNVKRDLWLQDSTSKTVDPDRYILRTYDSVPQVRIHRPYRKEFGIHPELWTK